MGQQQSSEKTDKPERNARSGTPQGEKDRKLNRRTSVQALSHGRSTPADPSGTNASATAQPASQHAQKPALHQFLQSAPAETDSRSKAERSTSRGSSARRNEVERRPREPSTPIPLPSGPMNVPTPIKSKTDEFEDQSGYHSRPFTRVAEYRPPRLPLPMADVQIPDSPVLQPVDKGNEDVSLFETEDTVPPGSKSQRRNSMLSTTTLDEDEVGDELQPYAVDTTGRAIDTVIEWNQSGERVYVTGTFATWDKKFRLHRRKDSHCMAATISLPPGTHHLMFLVDGQMKTNPDLPTAVDLNNVLVNYIEIVPDETHRARRESSQKPPKNIAYPAHPPLLPQNHEQYASGESTPDECEPGDPMEEEIPMGDFRQIVPQALMDMDLPEEDPRYQQAARIISEGMGPPSLPLFLGKSILNGNLPIKDDASVLTLPNHTVLNHLATSSVRNGVLSTSVTTRYKKKYVTTIMYKPKGIRPH